MKMLTIIAFGVLLVGILQAEMPDKNEIFTVHTFGGSDPNNYVSNNFIYSALPFYKELPDGISTPWKKNRHEQRGVIVTNDKHVYYFSTQDSSYLSITDGQNRTHALHLSKSPLVITKVPQHAGLPFNSPLTQDVIFCVSIFPWNTTDHAKSLWGSSKVDPVTPEEFVRLLPEWRLVTEADVPSRAIMAHTNEGPRVFPLSLTQNEYRPLNGVIVLTDRAVLKFFTRSSDAISLNLQYYIQTTKAEQDGGGQPATRAESK